MSEERLFKATEFEIQKEAFESEIEKFNEYTIFGKSKFQITGKEIPQSIPGHIVFFSDPNFKKDEYTYFAPFSNETPIVDLDKQVHFLIFIKDIPTSLAKHLNLEVQINEKKFTGVPYYSNDNKTGALQISISSWEMETNSGTTPIDSILIPNEEKYINSIELNIKIS